MRKIVNALIAMSVVGGVHASSLSSNHVDPLEKDPAPAKRFAPYVSLSGGYGSFDNMSQADTGFGRLALGVKSDFFPTLPKVALGAEIGIQSAKRMQLSNATVNPFFVNATDPLPVYMTISPPIDLLATVTYHLSSPVFLEVKAGGVYMQSMIEQANITGLNEWYPEVQAGVGFDVSEGTRLILSYQGFFANTPRLNQVNLALGTANLSSLPSWNAGMITLEKSF
jgi:hypothetical protein